MSNIVKWAAVSDEETFAKVRVEFSFGDGSAVQKTVTMADFIRARTRLMPLICSTMISATYKSASSGVPHT